MTSSGSTTRRRTRSEWRRGDSAVPRIAVVRFPGSNCDLDAVHSLKALGNADVDLVWHEDRKLGDYDGVVVPGGFSFGDFLRGGAIAARSPAMRRISRLADSGAPVLGICNGFQVLIEAGLLPGALLRNSSLRFVCKWVNVKVERGDTPFTRNLAGRILKIPIAHNEGRFYLREDELDRIRKDGEVAFRYCDDAGRATASSNPTGTTGNIAGVCNAGGNVLGLMPHPERAAEQMLSPAGSADGALILDSMVSSLR